MFQFVFKLQALILIELHFCRLCSQILTTNGTQVGKISKHWAGLAREFFTDSDYFGLSFPMDLDVYTKATLLGACMLIVNIFEMK